MIYDLIENKDLYTKLGEKYVKAFEFIEKAVKDGVECGRHIIDGDEVYANVSEYDTKTEAVYEAHKEYIDLQYVVSGHENLYYKNIKDCTTTKEYSSEGDYMLLTAEEPTVLDMNAGAFAILYPDDAHAPGMAQKCVTRVKKIVVKIKMD